MLVKSPENEAFIGLVPDPDYLAKIQPCAKRRSSEHYGGSSNRRWPNEFAAPQSGKPAGAFSTKIETL